MIIGYLDPWGHLYILHPALGVWGLVVSCVGLEP